MILTGPHSNKDFDLSHPDGAAQYLIDAFRASCSIGHEDSLEDIMNIEPAYLIQSFYPDSDFEDDDIPDYSDLCDELWKEIEKLRLEVSGKMT